MNPYLVSPPINDAHYVLSNVRIPSALSELSASPNGWCELDVRIEKGHVAQVVAHGSANFENVEVIDCNHSVLLSGSVDCHTHLDKAYVTAFESFPPGDLETAMAAMADNKKRWTRENLEARAEFSLRSAYAYGVRALRSHVDFSADTPDFVWETLSKIAQRWKGRVFIQLCPLANILDLDEPETAERIFAAAGEVGVLGVFTYDQPELLTRLKSPFERAKSENWDLDFHVDEGLDERLDGLNAIAQNKIETGFTGNVLCGHCVALNSYDDARREAVVKRVLEAGLNVVSLPVTNLYLQGRAHDNIPRQRGMTPVKYLAEAGVTTCLGADNVHDGFCTFGEFDPLSVLHTGAQIGHLSEPPRDWSSLITVNPSNVMRLDWDGVIRPDVPADLILLNARTSSEFGSRIGMERRVIRNGHWADERAPAFRELTG